jgi:hypothetical protein
VSGEDRTVQAMLESACSARLVQVFIFYSIAVVAAHDSRPAVIAVTGGRLDMIEEITWKKDPEDMLIPIQAINLHT